MEVAEAEGRFPGFRGSGERGGEDSEHGRLSMALAVKRRGPGLWGRGGVKVGERGEGVDSEQPGWGLALTPDFRPPSRRWARWARPQCDEDRG